MIITITCPYCKKEYSVDKRKIPANAKAAQCKACGKKFPLELDGDATARPKITTEKPEITTEKPEITTARPEITTARPEITTEEPETPTHEIKKVRTRKIAVSLSKGGVGKTTTAVNLAVGLAMADKKVLLVDTDTQGQVSFMLGVEPKAGLTELVTNELEADKAVIEVRDRLSLLAGGKSLAGLKRLISRQDFGGELTIKEALAPLEDQFDYIIFDSAPGWDVLTVNVLFCADEVLIPVSLEIMTLQGLTEFLKSVGAIQKHREGIEVKYVLPTFFDKRVKKSFTILKKLQDVYGQRLCTPIRTNVRVSEAPAYGKTIYEFAPGSPAAEDYRDLIRKVTGEDNLFR